MKQENETQTKQENETQTNSDENNYLILWNDDVNTFDWVINSLMEICHHTLEQAEQCATLTHWKGKTDIKKGEKERLQKMKIQFDERQIQTTIE